MYRIGLFYCAAPLSGAFGGLLATGLAEIQYGGLNSKVNRFFKRLRLKPFRMAMDIYCRGSMIAPDLSYRERRLIRSNRIDYYCMLRCPGRLLLATYPETL